MSDPTQTLSVEIEGLERLAADLGGNPKRALLTSVSRLRFLLSQPEHQGEPVSFTCCNWDKLSPESKKAVKEVVQAAAGQLDSPLSEDEQAEYEAARRSVVEARNAQSPTPALSDEERERLVRVAGRIDRLGVKIANDGAPHTARGFKSDAAFLRNLASREHPDA